MNIKQQAIVLANQPYTSVTFLDRATDGTRIWVAFNPQLEGCVSQGETMEEAQANLLDARIMCIEAMLEHDVTIPMPIYCEAKSFSSGGNT